jgi:hypothetical protein
MRNDDFLNYKVLQKKLCESRTGASILEYINRLGN